MSSLTPSNCPWLTPAPAVQELRDLIERMQAELKFKKTRIEALNFKVAPPKRWRFGMASSSFH